METKLYFRANKDKNGNTKYVIVDLDTKRVYFDYNLWLAPSECIIVKSQSELKDVANKFVSCGFKETIRIH